ncbi:hypothetical protein [Roseivirga misakiensis]|uniref:hypothetical protein n=1 Tax=Roseivirga misakiensis TaxID=1563681 RepID=UPI00159F1FC2|nr:hypothetical protein [Roseivirga misakiensis]
MNCLINETADRYLRKGRKIEVISRYIRLKYRISIENAALAKRLQLMNLNY